MFWGNPAFHSRQCFVVTACASVLMSSCSIISFFSLSLSLCVTVLLHGCCRCWSMLQAPLSTSSFFFSFFSFPSCTPPCLPYPTEFGSPLCSVCFPLSPSPFCLLCSLFFLFAVYIVLISVCLLIVFLILCSLCRHLYLLGSSFFSLTNLLSVFSVINIIFLFIFLVSVFCLLLDVCNVLPFLLLLFANRVPVFVHSVQLFFFVFT